MDLQIVAKEIHKTAVEHGWWEKERNLGEALLLVVSEVTEAFEEWRSGHPVDEVYYNGDKPEGYLTELADVIIRILDLVENEGLTQALEETIKIKMAYNDTRPYRHGGKKA